MRDALTHFSAARAFTDIQALYELTRWCTTPKILEAARWVKGRLKTVPGLTDVVIHEYPADGRTSYGGWMMPKGWDVRGARLRIASPDVADPVLADYQDNPLSLCMWSAPTPARGLEAPVAHVKQAGKYEGSLKGAIVLVDNLSQMSVDVVEWLAKSGAVALVSDRIVTVKGIKEGAYLNQASQFHNYCNPQWDGAPRLPAFSITPAKGKILRRLLQQGRPVRLHAWVDSKFYNGVLPVVSALLPGAGWDEVVITAHLDEPGASDNASGVAVAMELMRTLAAFTQERGRPLNRGVRFYASTEVRGLQAHLNEQKRRRTVIAGINLDMVGYEHTFGRTQLDIMSAQPLAPSFLEFILNELAEAEARHKPRFRHRIRRMVVVDDCHFAHLPYNAPMVCLEQAPDRTYHSSLDRPENLSQPHLARIGKLVATAMLQVTDGKFEDLRDLADRIYKQYERAIRKNHAGAELLFSRARRMLRDLVRLAPDGMHTPNSADVESMRRNQELVDGYLYPRAALDRHTGELTARLSALVKSLPKSRAPKTTVPASKTALSAARRLVPQKTFAGYLSVEDLVAQKKTKVFQKAGLDFGWGMGWVQWAADLANGKRTVEEIQKVLAAEAGYVELERILRVVKFLQATGKMRYRPVLKKKDLLAALRRVGIRSGDILMAHTSLSAFGYFEGGAQAVIDGLLEAVGPRGTLAVPTHSLSWIGALPYDPLTSASTVGAITTEFLKRPGVIRSQHPTHSVAVFGPMAAKLAAGHTPDVAPQSRAGFWGHLVEADGKILLMCKLSSNTLLHAGELWAGTPYPPCVTHSMRGGRRVETVTPGMPWHVESFIPVHKSLAERGLLPSTTLGESSIYSMRARDGIETMMKMIQADPHLAVSTHCRCRWCSYIRQHLKANKPAHALH